jgi:hypothetical protein
VQRQGLNGRVALQVVAQAFRHRQHALAHWQPRHDVLGQMGGGLDHAPRVAGRTHPPALTRVGYRQVVTALATAGTGKAVGENAAFEVAAKFALDVGRHRSARRTVTREFEPGRQVALHGAIEQCAFWLAAAIARGARGRAGRAGRHDHPDWGIGMEDCASVQSMAR